MRAILGFWLFLVVGFAPSVLPVMAQVVGGWEKVSAKDPAVVQAAQFAVAARQKALGDADGQAPGAGRPKQTVTLTQVCKARQQVVQGMNYRLLLEVKVGEETQTIEAIVWSRPWLKPEERNQLTRWAVCEKPAEF